MPALIQGSPVTYLRKHPQSIKRILVDWTAFAAGATITLSTWADVSGTGLTFSAPQISGTTTYASISGGTSGTTAYATNTVTFSDGRRDVKTIVFDVRDEVP